MLWILGSLFFLYCAWREVRRSMVAPPGYDFPQPPSKAYLIIALSMAALLAWTPVHVRLFERFLSAKATELAEGHRAKVHCNTIFDTMMDPDMLFAGHANFETGEIGIQHPWCDRLMAYLRHPGRATTEELVSLNILTHESMHVRGEHNEARTECQAVQRNYRTATLLGVPDRIARQNAMDYYTGPYLQRGVIGGMQGEYFSPECAPGKAMDEHLSDSTWARP
ncbi:MAG: hypothetical protein WB646_11795 [Steroidobacteraceae bacterium]